MHVLFNRDLNRSCLVLMFSLRLSGRKFYEIFFVYIKLFVHKFLRDMQSFRFLFKITKMRNLCSRLHFH